MKIVELKKEDYQDYCLDMSYESDYFYAVELHNGKNVNNFFITKEPFEETFYKKNSDRLYEKHFDGALAYGIFDGEILTAVIELYPELWANRLRITELWVHQDYRKQAYAGELLDFAKEKASAYRALILETQSSNMPAISLYLKHGFKLVAVDTIHYSNDDLKNREVRLDFAYLINS